MTDRKLYQRLGISAAEIRAALDCFRPIADGRELGVDVAFSRTLWIVARMQMVLGHFLLDEHAASRWQATVVVAEVEGEIIYFLSIDRRSAVAAQDPACRWKGSTIVGADRRARDDGPKCNG